MHRYLPKFDSCIQKSPPFCQVSCPFSLDVHSFIEKVRRGSFSSAYRQYRDAVAFPRIVSQVCHSPCVGGSDAHSTVSSQSTCPMVEPINLLAIEASVVENAKVSKPIDYNLPEKKGNIAIVGAGISGLGCALRLSTKKYHVEVFEKNDRCGGSLISHPLYESFSKEFQLQFTHSEAIFHYNSNIDSKAQLEGFDAVFIATGKGGYDFGCSENCDTGYFMGGSMLTSYKADALAQGLNAAQSIENYLKTGITKYLPLHQSADCLLDKTKDLTLVTPTELTLPYSDEDAITEAQRCLLCQCDSCKLHCDLITYYNKWPLRIRDEIQATTLQGTSEVKGTPAKRLISSCTQCGQCAQVCPKSIDIGGLIGEARKAMHMQNKLAWVYNEYFLRDMAFSNSEKASVNKSAPSACKTKYAFFPGCRLGGSSPQSVLDTYQYLTDVEPATGIMLSCCGIPAQWAGDEELFQKMVSQIESTWANMGKPTLILACPMCHKHFSKNLSHIPVKYLYDHMAASDLSHLSSGLLPGYAEQKSTVFDPCPTSPGDQVRTSVRRLLANMGMDVQPLSYHQEYTSCCSYGGHMKIANPQMAEDIVTRRIEESPLPYVTYCINCRDSFLSAGKKSYHILDLLFNNEPELVTISDMNLNRIRLKEELLNKFWGEDMKVTIPKYSFHIEIDSHLAKKMSDSHIWESDIYEVMDFCLRSKRTVHNEETNTDSGYMVIGHATYWVEFIQLDQYTYKLVNCYTHRMEIELEDVWNGEKRSPDL